MRHLCCDPSNGTWALSEATVTSSSNPAPEGGPLRHVSWSPTGSDLAVIDSVGRVTIMSIFSTLNKSSLHRPSQMDPVDDLHRVVGNFWLHIAPYGGSNRPVSTISLSGSMLLKCSQNTENIKWSCCERRLYVQIRCIVRTYIRPMPSQSY